MWSHEVTLICIRFFPFKKRRWILCECDPDWCQKNTSFSGTNQKPERRRPFGTGLVRHCPQGLFSPFFTFLRAIFFRPFRLFLVPTICPWVSEDGGFHDKATRRCVSPNSVSSDRPRQRWARSLLKAATKEGNEFSFQASWWHYSDLESEFSWLEPWYVLHDLFV